MVLLPLIGGWGWFHREALLQQTADLWIVSEPVEDGDAVVVLAGGVATRPAAAAELYRAGTVKYVLVTADAPYQLSDSQVVAATTGVSVDILKRSGVAPQAIMLVGRDVRSTYQEALAVREWAQRAGAKTIIVVTEMFSSRRVRWIFRKELAVIGVKVITDVVPEPHLDIHRWWQSQAGAVAFGREILKYLYYRIRY